MQAAEAGFAGIVMSASGPMMIYPGSRVAAVSSNPIAFAIPRKDGRPYLLDFSTGVVANGKIMGAADRGEAIPIGWGVDKDGRDTTDPKKVENVLPMAGIKGAGLSFMIECLTSLLLSEPRIAPDLESWAIGDDPFLNGSVIAIDPGAFGDRDRFLREAERLGTAIAGLARAEGVKKIMLPGERGDAIRAEREATAFPSRRARGNVSSRPRRRPASRRRCERPREGSVRRRRIHWFAWVLPRRAGRHPALAQQGERVRKVGVLINIAENDPQLQEDSANFVRRCTTRVDGGTQYPHRHAVRAEATMNSFPCWPRRLSLCSLMSSWPRQLRPSPHCRRRPGQFRLCSCMSPILSARALFPVSRGPAAILLDFNFVRGGDRWQMARHLKEISPQIRTSRQSR